MRQTIRRYMSWILTAFLCMCMLPNAAVEAAENQSGKSIDIPVEITAEGAMLSEPETYVITLTKQMENGPMPDFADSDTAELKIQGPGNGVFSFHFDHPGVFLYTITQKAGTKSNCIYDSVSYDLYIFVTNDGAGGLDINAYMENGKDEDKLDRAVFHNLYTGTAKYDPPIKKVVNVKRGKAPADSIFSFRMTPDDPSYPMPDNHEASYDPSTNALTMNVKGPGSYEFGWMYFDQSHSGKTYVYTVEEIDNGESDYSYDRNIYKLTVKVIPTEEGIELKTFITDDSGEESEMVFTNTYTGKEETPSDNEPDKNPPKKDTSKTTPSKKPSPNTSPKKNSPTKSGSKVKTGDENNTALWISISGVSMIAVFVLLFLQKKNKKDK